MEANIAAEDNNILYANHAVIIIGSKSPAFTTYYEPLFAIDPDDIGELTFIYSNRHLDSNDLRYLSSGVFNGLTSLQLL